MSAWSSLGIEVAWDVFLQQNTASRHPWGIAGQCGTGGGEVVGKELASESDEHASDHVMGLIGGWAFDGEVENAVENLGRELREQG